MDNLFQEIVHFVRTSEQLMSSSYCSGSRSFYLASWSGEILRLSVPEQGAQIKLDAINLNEPLIGLAVGPNGAFLIAFSDSGMAIRISAAEMKRETSASITAEGLSSCGICTKAGYVAVGGKNGSVYLVRTTDLLVLARWRCHEDRVTSVCVSLDQQMIASGAADGSISVLSPDSGPQQVVAGCHFGAILALGWSSKDLLASGGQDNLVNMWSLTHRLNKVAEFSGHESTVRGIDCDDRFDQMLTVSQDRTARLWRISDASCTFTQTLDSSWLTCMAFDSHRRLFVTGSLSGVVRVWKRLYAESR